MTNDLTTEEHTETHSGAIKAYKKLTPGQIDAVNAIKMLENRVGREIDDIIRQNPEIEQDGRWLSIGVVDLQKGFMSVVRSIAKPESDL